MMEEVDVCYSWELCYREEGAGRRIVEGAGLFEGPVFGERGALECHCEAGI